MKSYLDNDYKVITLPDNGVPIKPIRAKAIIFSDQNSRKLLSQVETIAPSSASVIIQGESGTGKELIAREIHLKSDRQNKPFLAVNCGALVETLAEYGSYAVLILPSSSCIALIALVKSATVCVERLLLIEI